MKIVDIIKQLKENKNYAVKIQYNNELYPINDYYIEYGNFIFRSFSLLSEEMKHEMDLSYSELDDVFNNAGELLDSLLYYSKIDPLGYDNFLDTNCKLIFDNWDNYSLSTIIKDNTIIFYNNR